MNDDPWGPPYTIYSKELPDGRMVGVIPMTYGKFRVVVGRGLNYDDGW